MADTEPLPVERAFLVLIGRMNFVPSAKQRDMLRDIFYAGAATGLVLCHASRAAALDELETFAPSSEAIDRNAEASRAS